MLSELSVLIIEDEVIVAIEVGEILRDLGFGDVRLAHNLRRAAREIETRHPDYAILDVNLGAGERTTEMGLELAETGTVVVFASGYNRSELPAEIQGFPFLEKPVSESALRRMTKSVLACG